VPASPLPSPRRASGRATTSSPTTSNQDRAAIVALLRAWDTSGDAGRTDAARRRFHEPTVAVAGSPAELLAGIGDAEQALRIALEDASGQTTLLPSQPEPLIDRARTDVERWAAAGIELISVLDDGYPANLHAVHDRPALLFVRGRLSAADERSIAVVGSRRPSPTGIERARTLARELSEAGHVVVSGLAAGIDAAAHTAALHARGRTLAVIGTGVDRVYPAAHAELQRRIAAAGAVISCFWPDQAAGRDGFPIRNGLMSGLTRGTVIVEASERSGTRVQAKRALGHGRPVFLHPTLLEQTWARELADRPNVHVAADAGAILATLRRQRPDDGPLVDA
jgi:DNA processing protein